MRIYGRARKIMFREEQCILDTGLLALRRSGRLWIWRSGYICDGDGGSCVYLEILVLDLSFGIRIRPTNGLTYGRLWGLAGRSVVSKWVRAGLLM